MLAPTTPRAPSSSRMRCGGASRRRARSAASRVSVDASVGIALAPEDGSDVGQLVRRADVAMYAAKQARAGVLRYDAASDRQRRQQARADDRASGRSRARASSRCTTSRSSTRDTGMLKTVEALVRWRHPTQGHAPAGRLHPARRAHAGSSSTSTGSCCARPSASAAIWRRLGVDLGVAVNISVLDLLERSVRRRRRGGCCARRASRRRR